MELNRTVLWSATLGDAPLKARVEAAAEHGYSVLSLSPLDGRGAIENGEKPAELKKWANDLGVKLSILDAFTDWYPHPPPKRATIAPIDLAEFMAIAVAFEVDSVSAVSAFPTDVGIDTVTEGFAQFCDRVGEEGMIVELEFTPIQPVNSVALAHQVLRDAGRTNSGIVFDTWHFYQGDPDFEALEAVPAGMITKAQVNDGHVNEFQEGRVKDTFMHRLLPGQGNFDLARVLRILDRKGALEMCGPEVLSLDLFAMTPPEAARVAAETYDALAATLRD
ncbi:MAG: Xylose isomerase protein barrel [Acidimicrobiia bacterium]|nr:Xylose isomerase protein barrel [Acidimicrobiia bacterium]